MIKLSVYEDDDCDFNTEWWINFVHYYEELGFDMDNDTNISKALKDWRGINDVGTVYIKFRNKQDVTLFMLRWV